MNVKGVEIKRGVPIPSRNRTAWPFREMEVDDYFHVDEIDDAEIAALRMCACRYGKTHNMLFTVRRQEGGGVRVWRVA
jgi:hypothetical protein